MQAEPKVKYLQLPYQFDELLLGEELDKVLNSGWIPHFNTEGYDGDWQAIPLYAPGGDPNNIYAISIEGQLPEPTPLVKMCPYIQSILQNFKCPLISVRVLRLRPGSYIKPHRDHKLGYEDGCFRIHVPIKTNPQVEFMLGGDLLRMQAGECWYTNVNCVHSVVNKGTTDRVHLVFDGQRNAWSDELFFKLAPEQDFSVPSEPQYDAATIVQIISELEKINSEATRTIIQELQMQLAQLKSQAQ